MTATLTTKKRIGVHADHDNYKWWALSCTSLGMLLATINSQPNRATTESNLPRTPHASFLALATCPWARQQKAREPLDADRYCDYTRAFIFVSTFRRSLYVRGPERFDRPHVLRFLAA